MIQIIDVKNILFGYVEIKFFLTLLGLFESLNAFYTETYKQINTEFFNNLLTVIWYMSVFFGYWKYFKVEFSYHEKVSDSKGKYPLSMGAGFIIGQLPRTIVEALFIYPYIS